MDKDKFNEATRIQDTIKDLKELRERVVKCKSISFKTANSYRSIEFKESHNETEQMTAFKNDAQHINAIMLTYIDKHIEKLVLEFTRL